MLGMSSIEISGTTTMYTYETYPKELYPTVLLKKNPYRRNLSSQNPVPPLTLFPKAVTQITIFRGDIQFPLPEIVSLGN